MKKALIYGLTLTFALTLTACGQPKAEEPGAPDSSASAAVQTASPETTKPTATPEPSVGTSTAPEETDTQPTEDTTTEPPAEQTPETPGETESTQPTEETETAPTAKPTTQTSTSQTQTPPSGESNSSADTPGDGSDRPAGVTIVTPETKPVTSSGENEYADDSDSGGGLTQEDRDWIAQQITGGGSTQSTDSTEQPQTPPDSGSVESDNVRTPAQTTAEDWIRQQLTGGSSFGEHEGFTDEEIADIGSKLNVTD